MDNNEAVVTEQNVVPEAEAKTFTQEEVDAMISKAINGAVQKAKEKANKTSDQRISELERELTRRDNLEYARAKMSENSIDSSLASLFFSEDKELTDAKVEAFSNWYQSAIDKAVTDRIKEAKPIKMAQSSVTGNRRRSLAEIQSNY